MSTPHTKGTCTDTFIAQEEEWQFLEKGILKKHVQLGFAWHGNVSIIPATNIAEQFFPVMFIVFLFFMEIIWLHVVIFAGGNEREICWCPEIDWDSD